MPRVTELEDGPFIRDDDEGLFSRDVDGQLVRLDAPTESDYQKTVTLQIDGADVTVPLAEPLTDANGNVILDIDGRTTPRYTTIYDAATKLYVQQLGDEAKIPIPVLCHQPHLRPVAVCRLCVVQIYGQKRGKRAAERKLLPACQHQVKDGMEVFTMNAPGPDGDRVRGTVKVLTELLATDHLKPSAGGGPVEELNRFNELGQMVDRCGADPERFKIPALANRPPAGRPLAAKRSFDATSPVFVVDHSACILCDRCVRACDEVMENHVIGRTGKGSNAGVGFDLNDPMGESSCVKCGECMVSCPTSAITFKPVAQIKLPSHDRANEVLPTKELISDPLFAGVPPKFLLWQQGLVIRRKVKAGQVLCEQGGAGNTAFVIRSGRLEVLVHPPEKRPLDGVFSGLLPRGARQPLFRGELTAADLIVGEMACITGTPRSATVTALDDGEVWEVRRNVLDRLMRRPALREVFEQKYRDRSLDLVLQDTDMFRGMKDEERLPLSNYLRTRLTFVRVRAGQKVFERGGQVTHLYIVRLGQVRVALGRHDVESKIVSVGAGAVLGEISLLGLTRKDAGKSVDQVEGELKAALDAAGDDLTAAFPPGRSTATCTALGQLELARISRVDFLKMVRDSRTFRRRMIEQSLARMRGEIQTDSTLHKYVEQGLFEGQSILVLDLDLCTRCDECTRGCIDQHGTASHGIPIPRLLRDGMRFENYTIATSCRSCTDPHCMVGCPVDSIHRGKHLQIVIEDHCIGCGLCASNCPYGSIFMVKNERRRIAVPSPDNPEIKQMVAQPKAATCDLCDAEGHRESPRPRCVSACPHDAAHRITGPELLRRVVERGRKR